MPDKAMEVLLDEKRNFPPPKQFKKSANVRSASIFNLARKGNPQAYQLHGPPHQKGLDRHAMFTMFM
jgi:hypothetical protein